MHHHSLSVVDQGKNKANIMQYIQGIQSTSMKYAGSARCIRDKYNNACIPYIFHSYTEVSNASYYVKIQIQSDIILSCHHMPPGCLGANTLSSSANQGSSPFMYREEAGKSESKGSGARASKEPGSGCHCPAVSFRSLIKLQEMPFEASCKRVYTCCLRANVSRELPRLKHVCT